MVHAKEDYVPLSATLDEDDLEQHAAPHPSCTGWRTRIAVLLVIVLQSLAIVTLLLRRPSCCSYHDAGGNHFLYSPAKEVLDDEVVIFRTGTGHISAYQELSNDADKLWSDLYVPSSVFMIPREIAVRLPNRTYPVPKHAEEGLYFGQLDVFHQLHCLNYLRMGLTPERYRHVIQKDLLEYEHLNHCIDSIRQSLMCSSDVSVNVWQWSEQHQSVVGRLNVAHSCRNFDKIRDWARERAAPQAMNVTQRIENDLPYPPIFHSAQEYLDLVD
ncbi:hypothetical protein FB107DRAFT_275608 [Schizophyllum commune]